MQDNRQGNINVSVGEQQGIYAGSATNMARLFILCNVIWHLLWALAFPPL